ncbi:hypothetical protein VCHA28O22_100027 [Vibrio chagasii]|nr:hypothetical protein VCHA28O22_100027 [Vibrio chagasii]CAH6904742.1 hypothetical protein VCHA41O246_100011 [Vibrio chagasii]CAH6991861.1 hypothetical protein VCHA50O393_150119 [Vibrio chagasii]CAH7015336.1 hypothetical protein VCHA53O474_150121 [Vibrio chagasii]
MLEIPDTSSLSSGMTALGTAVDARCEMRKDKKQIRDSSRGMRKDKKQIRKDFGTNIRLK